MFHNHRGFYLGQMFTAVSKRTFTEVVRDFKQAAEDCGKIGYSLKIHFYDAATGEGEPFATCTDPDAVTRRDWNRAGSIKAVLSADNSPHTPFLPLNSVTLSAKNADLRRLEIRTDPPLSCTALCNHYLDHTTRIWAIRGII